MSEKPDSFLSRLRGLFSSSADDALPLGSSLPAVKTDDESGRPVDLSITAASGWTLVYFYPRADTPGCTKQACSLRDSFADLTDQSVKVYGVSLDNVPRQKAFHDKYQLPFPLLADTDAKLAKAFGVPSSLGFTRRQAFLFKDGRLVWRDLTASTDEQARDVLEALCKYNDGSH